MVKKLIKYDFKSYFRLLLPVQLILIGIAAINRIIQFFETEDSIVYSGVFTSSLVLYIISIFVLLFMTVIVSIVRFYQGMYTKEGYLSHTLPVTPAQHIKSKLLTSLLFYLGALAAIFISFIVITIGDVNIELFKAFGYLLGKFFSSCGIHAALFILEGVLLLFAWAVRSFLKNYFCISVGQLVSRKRILLAFGVYFGIYVLSQIVGTVFIILITLNPDWISFLYMWFVHNPLLGSHIILCGYLVVEVILGMVYYLFTKKIMTKKLNLT